MNQERIIWLVAVILVGTAAFFGGRQMGMLAGQESRTAAAAQFFAQRGGDPSGQSGQGFAGARGQGVSGEVAAVEGDTLSLTLSDGSTVTVTLAADGVVRRQVDGTLGDLQVGDRVVAIGQRSGDSVSATSIQVGGFGGFGGAPPEQGGNQPQP